MVFFDKYILGSGTNVFEMTMAEEDREDQKRRFKDLIGTAKI